MTLVIKRELDLSPEEREHLLRLSRRLFMQNNFEMVEYDDQALCDLMAPAPAQAEALPAPVQVQEEAVLAPPPDDAPPVDVAQENDQSEGEGEHDAVAAS